MENRKKITFMCNKDEFPIEDLKLFTKKCDCLVIIRNYGTVESGCLKLHN